MFRICKAQITNQRLSQLKVVLYLKKTTTLQKLHIYYLNTHTFENVLLFMVCIHESAIYVYFCSTMAYFALMKHIH